MNLAQGIKVIGFDADDTLWVNEPFFREAEKQFVDLLSVHGTEEEIIDTLYRTEISNLELYGYGIKAFILSLLECALRITQGNINPATVSRIIGIGKDMLQRPIRLLDGVQKVLEVLAPRYRLIVATKGDLLDQERKMKKSGIASFFHHIEVMSDKKEQNYIQLFRHLDIEPCQFLMVGNSMKSDIIPLLNLGSKAIYIPFHTTWIHEEVDEEPDHKGFARADRFEQVLDFVDLFNRY